MKRTANHPNCGHNGLNPAAAASGGVPVAPAVSPATAFELVGQIVREVKQRLEAERSSRMLEYLASHRDAVLQQQKNQIILSETRCYPCLPTTREGPLPWQDEIGAEKEEEDRSQDSDESSGSRNEKSKVIRAQLLPSTVTATAANELEQAVATVKKKDLLVHINHFNHHHEDDDDNDNDDDCDDQDKNRTCGDANFPSLPLLPHEPSLPNHNSFVSISKNYHVPDEPVLKFVPYFDGEQTATNELLDQNIFDTRQRERGFDYGSDIQQHEVNELLDQVIETSLTALEAKGMQWSQVGICQAVTHFSRQAEKRVQERYRVVVDREKGIAAVEEESTSPSKLDLARDSSEVSEGEETENEDDAMEGEPANAEDVAYLEGQDSYRFLFCRRCFIYDCNIHGLKKRANPGLQYQLAKQKERDGIWPKAAPNDLDGENDPLEGTMTQLSDFHKRICKRMFLIFDGNVKSMSICMRAPRQLIADYIKECNYQMTQTTLAAVIPTDNSWRDRNHYYYSVKRYKKSWYQAHTKAKIHPFYEPCMHPSRPCDEHNCSCIKNLFFCSKACLWARQSRNFYRGCGCKGSCSAKSCTCFAANRECDPDLCACDACTDPPNQTAVKQKCRNDNLTMNRRQHLLIAESSVPGGGWGVFTKYAVQKNEFLSEYVGELISQEEADRRGVIHDERRCSYLFNLSSDRVVDGFRKGNKARFLNHSENPNCRTKILFVNGEQRIGIFADRALEAQSELFFDYRYNHSMDNHKPAKPYYWETCK